MKDFDAILRVINEKLEDNEKLIDFYLRENMEKDRVIRELRKENEELKAKLEDLINS